MGAAKEAPSSDNVNASSTNSKAMEMWFNRLDTKKVGWLSIEQITQGLSDFGYSEYEIEAIFLSMDSNMDDKISLGEFVVGMQDMTGDVGEKAVRARARAELARDHTHAPRTRHPST